MLGFTQSVHTLERDQREMATAVAEFWAAQPAPPLQQEGEILVCTADGKGVAMRGGANGHAHEALRVGSSRKGPSTA
jgi:hypothetical protein